MMFFVLNCPPGEAQKSDPTRMKVDRIIENYMQFSRLGPGYSREMSPEIMDQFYALFEKDAFLFWDLYQSTGDSILPPLPCKEYIARAQKLYQQKQPVLDYPRIRIRIEPDENHATVYVEKVNQVMTTQEKTLRKNNVMLRINVNLSREQPLIQNIFEDRRAPFIQSISMGLNLIPWSNVLNALTKQTAVFVGSNERFTEIDVSAGTSFQVGGMIEMNFSRDHKNGLRFCTGLFYSQIPVYTVMQNYSRNFPDTLDKSSANPLACTTFERSPQVREKLVVKKIEVPLLFKTYLANWAYIKAGTALAYVTGYSDINYLLSRTGGGMVTNLATLEQFYLDENHELDQKDYGYYRDKHYDFPKKNVLNKVIFSLQFATGFEKQFNYFSFGIEPNISFGMNPLSVRSVPGNYHLNNIREFNTIVESIRMPAFEFTFGIRFMMSYVFKN